MNSKYLELIKHAVKSFNLKLDDYNVLLPACPNEPSIMAIIAAVADAKNIYVKTSKHSVMENIYKTAGEFGFDNIRCIEETKPVLLSGMDIVVKGGEIDKIDNLFINQLSKKSVISLFPENLDFGDTEGINVEACDKKTIPVAGIDPQDKNLNLYKYFSNIVLKRCYEAGLDVFKSKLFLAGHGSLLNSTLELLKAAGAVVYVYNLQSTSDQAHTLKHLPEVDAIIAIDYPQTAEQLIGSKGVISISDIVDLNPSVKIIHFCGKLETGSLNFGKIQYYPDKINQNSINLNIRELDERSLIEITTACLKIGEDLTKTPTNSMNLNSSVVTYKVLNRVSPVLSGRTFI